MAAMIGLVVRRAREERLPQVAGSLTFTTVLSVVPLLAVSFALFMRVPAFRKAGKMLQAQLLQGVLPESIARTVLRYLQQFAANTGGLTLVGFFFVAVSALALLLTVENVLNRIWQVKKDRPLHRRVGLFLLILVAGPPVVGASLWATSWALAASAGLLHRLPTWGHYVLELGPVLLGMAGLACIYYFVPNTQVRRRDALVGGLLASIGFELGKRGFAAWLLKVPTYKTVYGAFATVPVFLLWVYVSWLITLGAALVAASLSPGAQRARPAVAVARRPARQAK
jgi:membrane protein